MLSLSTRACLRALAAALSAVLAPAVRLPAQQANAPAGSISKTAGEYTLALHLPANGLKAGEPNSLDLVVSPGAAQAQQPPITSLATSLSMPAMAGMSIAPPIVTAAGPGRYRISASFPHSGGYRLEVRISAAERKAVTAAFDLNVSAAGAYAHTETMTMRSVAGVGDMQMASGTSWQPAVTPMYGVDKLYGKWSLMTHYNVSVNYDRQEGPRGDYQVNSTNWAMTMANRDFGKDRLDLRSMVTIEPLTVTPRGYPLLFQSGEQYNGRPIVDRQHPHNLIMEAAARYTHPTGSDSALFAYLAPVGEPALGPTAFMHRASALDLPVAPITHHWMDSTHVSWGVITVGGWKRSVQVDASYFTGREPGQDRYEIGPFHPDSFSGRVSWNPGPNWSTQASYGYLHSPEALRPGEDLRRTTVSAAYTLPLRSGGWWASTLAIANNSTEGINSPAYLLETEWSVAQRNTVFARLEFVSKLAEELNLAPATRSFAIGELTLGYVRELMPNRPYQIGVGGAITLNPHASSLNALYGQLPLGFWLFVRIRPAMMQM